MRSLQIGRGRSPCTAFCRPLCLNFPLFVILNLIYERSLVDATATLRVPESRTSALTAVRAFPLDTIATVPRRTPIPILHFRHACPQPSFRYRLLRCLLISCIYMHMLQFLSLFTPQSAKFSIHRHPQLSLRIQPQSFVNQCTIRTP